MSAEEHKPASTPDEPPQEPPRWVRRLRDALQWSAFVFLGSVLLATGFLPIHLTGMAQQIAYIVVIVEFVVLLPGVYTLIVAEMRRNPPTSRLQAWGLRLLVIGCFGLGPLLLYALIISLLPGWHRSNIELLVLTILGALMFALLGLGLVLVVVALIGEFRQLVHSRDRHPPSDPSA